MNPWEKYASPAAVAEPPKAEAGPWEKYAAPEPAEADTGPWSKYQQPPQGMGDLKAAESTMPEPPVAGMGDLKTAEAEIPVRPAITGDPMTVSGMMEQFRTMREGEEFDKAQGIVPEHQKPLIEIPKPERTGPVSGVVRGALNVAEAMTTEENLALLATGVGAPEVVGKVIAASFVPMMAKGTIEGVQAGIEAPTAGEKAEKFTEAALSLGMAGLAAKHAVGRPMKGGTAEIPRVGAEDIILASEKAVQEIIAPKPPAPSTGTSPTTEGTVATPTGEVEAGAGVVPSRQELTPSQERIKADVLKPDSEKTEGELLGQKMAVSYQPPETRPGPAPLTGKLGELKTKAEEIAGEPAEVSGKQEPIAPLSTETAPKPIESEPTVTSTKNAVTDAERAARGTEPLESGAHVSNETTWKQAEAELQADPKKGVNLVKELNESPRPITSVENDVLLREKIAVHNRGKELLDTINDPKTTEEARARASEELSRNDADIDAIDTALRLGGTETGRALQARQKMAAEDFTLTAMRARVRAQQGGKPLDAGQEATIKDLHDKLEASQKRIAELEEKGSSEKAATTLKNLAGEGTKQKPLSGPVRSKLMERLKASHDEAVVNLRKRLGRTSTGVDPTILADVAKIGAYHIANGATKLGQFTQRMVKELGDWIKGDIKDIYKAARAEFDAARNAARDLEPADAREAVLQKVAGGKLTQKNVFDLARHHVNEGVTELDAVMDAVKQDLSESHPDITTRELRDLFSGYGDKRYPSKEADLTKLRELRRLGQLASAIEDAQQKINPKKSGTQRDKPTQAIRDKMKELKAAMEEAGIETTSPEQQLASRNQARATALRNQIEDLERRIATGQQKPKGKPVPDSAEVSELKQQRDALKKEADALFPEDTEAQRIATAKAAIKRSTERLKARIKAGDYAPTPRREPATSRELEDLRFENAKVRQEFARKAFEAKLAAESLPWKATRKVGEALNLARAIMTSVDLSAVFRQGGFIGLAHPGRAIKSVPAMIRALFSEKAAFKVDEEIASRPNAKLYKQAKLYLAEQNNHIPSKMEEAYMSRWLERNERVPGQPVRNVARTAKNVVLAPVRGSARAYSTFLNKLRADSFDAMAATLSASGKPTLAEAKAIANFVNVATGRGSLGKAEPAGEFFATIFFAPRYVASRFQLLGGAPMFQGTARTKKLVAGEYARYLAGVGTMYALAFAALGDDFEVELDPRSSDFGKIRIGKTRIDPLSGLAQITTFLSREITGETKSLKGDILRMRESLRPLNLVRDKDPTKKHPFDTDATVNFLRSKLAPVPAAAYNLKKGKNIIGEEVTPRGELANLFTPLSVRDIYDTMREQGATRGTALMLLSLLGMGVQTYDEKKPR